MHDVIDERVAIRCFQKVKPHIINYKRLLLNAFVSCLLHLREKMSEQKGFFDEIFSFLFFIGKAFLNAVQEHKGRFSFSLFSTKARCFKKMDV